VHPQVGDGRACSADRAAGGDVSRPRRVEERLVVAAAGGGLPRDVRALLPVAGSAAGSARCRARGSRRLPAVGRTVLLRRGRPRAGPALLPRCAAPPPGGAQPAAGIVSRTHVHSASARSTPPPGAGLMRILIVDTCYDAFLETHY